MHRVLVTGDRGYIGSSLAPLLINKGYKIVGLDTNYFRKGLATSDLRYRRINKDIRKIEKKDFAGIDAVVHLAALSNDPLGAIDPKLTQVINYQATVRLAQIAKEVGVKRFIFSSSCSVYGVAGDKLVDEDTKPHPVTDYAKSKIRAEEELIRMCSDDFTVAIMRNPTVYGFSPKFRCDLVVNDLILSALLYDKIKVLSDGTPWRPFIDVRDLSTMFEVFLGADKEQINGEIFNVGFSNNNYQIKEVAQSISSILDLDISYSPKPNKDRRSYKIKFNKFEKLFPKVKQKWLLDKSVKDMIRILNKSIKAGGFEKQDYVRLSVLQSLIKEKKLTKSLYWKI